MKKELVSIIIPTLNEADFWGHLLFSLSRQTYQDFEVIVSDGNSRDQTLAVAKSFRKLLPSLKITTSRKRSPAHQRNQGAKIAKYEQLLFLDADIILPYDFLDKALAEIQKKKLDIACGFYFPISKKNLNLFHFILLTLQNVLLDTLEHFHPIAGGWTIFSRLTLHKKLGGFSENLYAFGEDSDYVERAVKNGVRFGMLKTTEPYVSTRRTDYENWHELFPNWVIPGLYYLGFGPRGSQKLIRGRRKYGDYAKLKRSNVGSKRRNQIKRTIRELHQLLKDKF